jgi:hypothetical protein
MKLPVSLGVDGIVEASKQMQVFMLIASPDFLDVVRFCTYFDSGAMTKARCQVFVANLLHAEQASRSVMVLYARLSIESGMAVSLGISGRLSAPTRQT